MEDQKSSGLYVFVTICVIIFLGVLLLGSWWQPPRSGNSLDAMLAALDDQETSATAVERPSARNSRRSAGDETGTSSRDRLVRRNETLQNRLDRKTIEYRALQAKYNGLVMPTRNESDGRDRSANFERQIADRIGIRSAGGDRRTDRGEVETGDRTDQSGSEASSSAMTAELNAVKERLKTAQFLLELHAEELEQLKQENTAKNQEQEVAARENAATLQQSRELQAAASRALARLGASAVPALADALSDHRASVREWAADVLGAIGPDAKDAVPALMNRLSDREAFVRQAAREALLAIDAN